MSNKQGKNKLEAANSQESEFIKGIESRLDELQEELGEKSAKVVKTLLTAAAAGSIFLGACQSESPRVIELPNMPQEVASESLPNTYDEVTSPWEGSSMYRTYEDSLGGNEYQKFIGNSEKMVEAWTVEGSIYAPWYRLQNLKSIESAPSSLKPRWDEGETLLTLRLKVETIKEEIGFENTAIIIDAFGPHSAAAALKLVTEGGWQPVPMNQEVPCVGCQNPIGGETLGVYLYGAAEVGKHTKELAPDAPPAFIWSASRKGLYSQMDQEGKNAYSFSPEDLPSPDFLKEHGIDSILYLTETPEYDNEDTMMILDFYEKAGIKIEEMELDPVPFDPYFTEKIESLGQQYMEKKKDTREWNIRQSERRDAQRQQSELLEQQKPGE
ncbi:hypothetical protein C4561_04485 [candidate division WWE3 bacterium]|jgi:hypothetical protein|uniref:Uncharacterized protein n=1 Tax=candidate division WWE3 bacterium TaxID=2053526 RepID=A0A3A4ZCM9_UNCKA|nr:MAG: hypothetical protein C4561_04485 [candidate division WWE3 bacterium]